LGELGAFGQQPHHGQNLTAAVIRFEHPESAAALLALIDSLNGWLAVNPELKRTFAIWIRFAAR